jgi:hypothetical protein
MHLNQIETFSAAVGSRRRLPIVKRRRKAHSIRPALFGFGRRRGTGTQRRTLLQAE